MSAPGDLEELESFMEELEGDFDNFFPSAFVKLHFLEGVLCVVGVAEDLCSEKEWCLEGVAGKLRTSRDGLRSVGTSERRILDLSSARSDIYGTG